jgi:hypothetical protein
VIQQLEMLIVGICLAGAGLYFVALVRDSIRDGEVARFSGNVWTGLMGDMAAEARPEFRSWVYISRSDAPIRFWIAITIRCLVAAIAFALGLAYGGSAITGLVVGLV